MTQITRKRRPAGPVTLPEGARMRVRDPELLRARMVELRLTFALVAERAGCAPSFVSHLIPARGRPACEARRSSCTPELAVRLAKALEAPVDELFSVGQVPA